MRSRPRASALTPLSPGEPRVLPHVRVDEDVPARRGDSRDLSEHVRQRLRRQVLEHVERVTLREGPVGERQLRRSPISEVDAFASASARSTGHVDADERRAALVVPDEGTPAAAPEIDDHVGGTGSETPQHPLRTAADSSGGDTVSCRASPCSASSRYFVCSVNDAEGRRSRIPGAARGTMSARGADERVAAVDQRPTAVRAADERQQARRDHAAAPAACRTGSSRAARASQLYRSASSNALRDNRSANARSSRTRPSASASTSARPGSTSSPLT